MGHLYQHVVGVGRLFASSSVAASGRPFELEEGEFERPVVSLLLADEGGEVLDFGRIEESALHSGKLSVEVEQHVAHADEVVGPRLVDDGT